jgi:hypothetical protein
MHVCSVLLGHIMSQNPSDALPEYSAQNTPRTTLILEYVQVQVPVRAGCCSRPVPSTEQSLLVYLLFVEIGQISAIVGVGNGY